MKGDGKAYTANIDIPGLGGIGDVKAGETFTGLESGVAAFLVGRGDISEGRARSIGESALHPTEARAVADMTRADLLAELSRGMDEAALREAVEAKRAHEAETGGGTSGSGKPAADTFADLDEADQAEAKKLMRSGETKLRELAAAEEAEGVKSDSDKAEIVRAVLAKRRAKAAERPADTFDAAAFVDRNLDDIADDELAGLSAGDRAAVRAAEDAREGGARIGLTDRLDKLDAPAS